MKNLSLNEFLAEQANVCSNDEQIIQSILRDVRERKDAALYEYNKRFDKFGGTLRVENPLEKEKSVVPSELLQAFEESVDAVRCFSERQMAQCGDFQCELMPGVFTGQRVIPVQSAGVYVPAGRFPLISSVLMGIVPAVVAGVQRIVVCSPASEEGVNQTIAEAAFRAGATEVYAVGGAQAIGAMAYGTETIAPVDVIVGPGNKYVAGAKKQVYGDVGIDFIAGPTEVCIIADSSANPVLVAADMLAQLEHDPDAQALLITDSPELSATVAQELKIQSEKLTNCTWLSASIERNAISIMVSSMSESPNIADRIAPEHLSIQTVDAKILAKECSVYGSLFIGEYAAEVFGDYCAGINHTLPTQRAARYTGGLSVRQFLTFRTTLEMTESGSRGLAQRAALLAEAEGLTAHMQSALLRKDT